MDPYQREESDSEQDNDQIDASGNGNSEVGPKRAIRRWTPEEHAKLVELVNKQQEDGATEICWSGIAKHLKGRSGKQCRHRWVNSCQPFTKRGAWDLDEEHVVAQLHASHGSAWSFIASQLKGRSENSVKNHYNALFRSKYLDSKKESVLANYVKMLREGHPQSTDTYETALSITQAYRSQALSHMSVRGNAPLPRPPRRSMPSTSSAGGGSMSQGPPAPPGLPAAPPAAVASAGGAPGYHPALMGMAPPVPGAAAGSRLMIDQHQQANLLNHLESFEWDWAMSDLGSAPAQGGARQGGDASGSSHLMMMSGGAYHTAAAAAAAAGAGPANAYQVMSAAAAPSLDEATIAQILSDWNDQKPGEGDALGLAGGTHKAHPSWPTITSSDVKPPAHGAAAAHPVSKPASHGAALIDVPPPVGHDLSAVATTSLASRLAADSGLLNSMLGGPLRTLSGRTAMFTQMNELSLGRDLNGSINLEQLLATSSAVCDLGQLPSPAGIEHLLPVPGSTRKPQSCPGAVHSMSYGTGMYITSHAGNLSQPGDSSTAVLTSAARGGPGNTPTDMTSITSLMKQHVDGGAPVMAAGSRQRRHSFTVPQDIAGAGPVVFRSVYAGTKRSSTDRLGDELGQPGEADGSVAVPEPTSSYNGHAINVPQPTNSTHSSSLNVGCMPVGPASSQAVAWGSGRDAVFLPPDWTSQATVVDEEGDCAFYMAPRAPRAQRLYNTLEGGAEGRKPLPRRRHSVAVTSAADSAALAAYLPEASIKRLSVVINQTNDPVDGLDGATVSSRPRQRRRSAEASAWNIPDHLNPGQSPFINTTLAASVVNLPDTHMTSPGAQVPGSAQPQPHVGAGSSTVSQTSAQQGTATSGMQATWPEQATSGQALQDQHSSRKINALLMDLAKDLDTSGASNSKADADDDDGPAVISNPKAVFGVAHAFTGLDDALMGSGSVPQDELSPVEPRQPPRAGLVRHSDAAGLDVTHADGSYASLNSLLLHSEELPALGQVPSVFGSTDLGTDWLRPLGSGAPASTLPSSLPSPTWAGPGEPLDSLMFPGH